MSELEYGLMTELDTRPAGSVRLTTEAERELKRVPRPTRALLARTMRDQLLEPNWRAVKQLTTTQDEGKRFAVPIGNFWVVFRPLDDDEGQPSVETRLVEHIVHADDLSALGIRQRDDDDLGAKILSPGRHRGSHRRHAT